MEVSALVQQMHENLSAIHETISGLTTESHNALLTELEQKREALLEELRAAFDKEQEEVNSKRQQEVDEINEKRRIEDEEREARRRQEDEDLQSKNDVFDLERHEKLDGDIKQIDEDTDKQMDEVEAAARKVIEDARLKLSELEEKRKEINRLIDEQLQLPLPEVPTRKRARAEKPGDAAQSSEEPASEEVVSAEAASAEPESTEPESAEPESVEPEKAEPESAEPESTAPESLELVKAQDPVDAANNGDEQPVEATGEPTSMQDPSIVEEQSDNNDKALETETPPSSEEADLPKEGGEDDADTQQQDGEEENPREMQLMSLQVADSGVGLDPEVEAGKLQPASPSGSEFQNGTGDGSPKEGESIANDMAGSPNGEQEEAIGSANPLEPEAAVDANEDLNTSQPDPLPSCENQAILSEPAPESTSSNSADEEPVEDASPSPEEDIHTVSDTPVVTSREAPEIDMADAQPVDSAPAPSDLEVSDPGTIVETTTDESDDSGLPNMSKQLDTEEQGDDASGAGLAQPAADSSEPVTIEDSGASQHERSIHTDEKPLGDADQAEPIHPVMESSESVEIEQPDVVPPEDSVQSVDPDSTAEQTAPIVEDQEPGPVEESESTETKSISPPSSRPTTPIPIQNAEEEEAGSSPSSVLETAQISDAMVSEPQECEPGTDSELPDEISGEPQESVSHGESEPVKESPDMAAAADTSEVDQVSNDAAKLEAQPDLHADPQDVSSDAAAVEQQNDSSISQSPKEVEASHEAPQESISDSAPQVEPVDESPVPQNESDEVESDPQLDSHSEPQDVTADAVEQSDHSTESQIPGEEAVVAEKSQEGTPDSTIQAEPAEESLVTAQNESNEVESEAQPDSQLDLQDIKADAADQPDNSTVSQIPELEEVVAVESQEGIPDSTLQAESVEESPVVAQNESNEVESEVQPDSQSDLQDVAAEASDHSQDSISPEIPEEDAVVTEKSQEGISDSTAQVEPVEESPVVAQKESNEVESEVQPDSQPDLQDVTAGASDHSQDSIPSEIPEEDAVVTEKSQEGISDSTAQVEPVEESPVATQNESGETESDQQPDSQPDLKDTAADDVEQQADPSISQTPKEVEATREAPQEDISDSALQDEPVEEKPAAQNEIDEMESDLQPDSQSDLRDIKADAAEQSDNSTVSQIPEEEAMVPEKSQEGAPDSALQAESAEESPVVAQNESNEVESEVQPDSQSDLQDVKVDSVVDQPNDSSISQISEADIVVAEQPQESITESAPEVEIIEKDPIATQNGNDAAETGANNDTRDISADPIDQPSESSAPLPSEAEEVIAEKCQEDVSDSTQADLVEEGTVVSRNESEEVKSDTQTDPQDVSNDASVDQSINSTAIQPTEAVEETGENSEVGAAEVGSQADPSESPIIATNESDAVKSDTQTDPQDDADVDQPVNPTVPQPDEAEDVVAEHPEEVIVDSNSQIDIVKEDSVISHSHDDLVSTIDAGEKEIIPTTIVSNDQIEGSEHSLANEEAAPDGDNEKSLAQQEDVSHPKVDAGEDESHTQPVNIESNPEALEEPHQGNADLSHGELEDIAVSTTDEKAAALDHDSSLDVKSGSTSIDGDTSLSSLPAKSLVDEDEDSSHHIVTQPESDQDLDQSIHESRIDEQVGTTPNPRQDLDSSHPPNNLSDDSWQSEPSRESNQRSSSPEEQQPEGISGEKQDQEEGDSHSAERDDSVEPGRRGGPFDSTYVDEDYSLYSISNYADDSLDDGQNILGHYRRDEHRQVASRSPVMDQSAVSAGPESADESSLESSRHLVVDTAPRQTTRSPLPVENVTVQGQDDLFDDSTASSHFSDEEDSEIIDSGFPEQRFVRDIHPAPLSAVSYDGAGWGDEDITDEMETEHPGNTEAIQQPTPTQSQFDFANSFGIRMVKDAERQRDSGFGIRMVPDAEQQHDFKPDPRTQTPSLTPFSYGNSQEVSPLVLQGVSPMTPNSSRGGLASSRHAPENDPQTPTRRLERLAPELEADFDPSMFMPRDVTNVPWHARNDSEPYSMHSQSTVSSGMSSPVHSALPVDKHEPVIRDSWHFPTGNGERSRANTQLTDRSSGEDFDPFKYDAARTPAYDINSPRRSVQVHQPITEPSRNSIAGSPMFQKLRNMFEPPTASSSSSGRSSPTRSRPVSSIFHPVGRDRSSSLRESHIPDSGDSPRRGEFLNEHEDDINENSALLQNPDGHPEH